MYSDNEKKFLIGLEKLTRETGIVIGGCGCCSSPYLSDASITSDTSGYGEASSGEVRWIDPIDDYDWYHYSSTIVKPPQKIADEPSHSS